MLLPPLSPALPLSLPPPRLVKDTSNWTNKKELLESEQASTDQLAASLAELDAAGLAARLAAAVAQRDEAQATCDAAAAAVEAAQNELAGAEAGDGRDASNRSMQERVADALNAATEAEAGAKQAETRVAHLKKALKEQEKALAAKEKEGSGLERELQRETAAVEACRQRLAGTGHDAGAAEAAEEAAQKARVEVRRWKEQVDELGSQLSGASACVGCREALRVSCHCLPAAADPACPCCSPASLALAACAAPRAAHALALARPPLLCRHRLPVQGPRARL